jgi:hypothetical protein
MMPTGSVRRLVVAEDSVGDVVSSVIVVVLLSDVAGGVVRSSAWRRGGPADAQHRLMQVDPLRQRPALQPLE